MKTLVIFLACVASCLAQQDDPCFKQLMLTKTCAVEHVHKSMEEHAQPMMKFHMALAQCFHLPAVNGTCSFVPPPPTGPRPAAPDAAFIQQAEACFKPIQESAETCLKQKLPPPPAGAHTGPAPGEHPLGPPGGPHGPMGPMGPGGFGPGVPLEHLFTEGKLDATKIHAEVQHKFCKNNAEATKALVDCVKAGIEANKAAVPALAAMLEPKAIMCKADHACAGNETTKISDSCKASLQAKMEEMKTKMEDFCTCHRDAFASFNTSTACETFRKNLPAPPAGAPAGAHPHGPGGPGPQGPGGFGPHPAFLVCAHGQNVHKPDFKAECAAAEKKVTEIEEEIKKFISS